MIRMRHGNSGQHQGTRGEKDRGRVIGPALSGMKRNGLTGNPEDMVCLFHPVFDGYSTPEKGYPAKKLGGASGMS